MKKPKKQQRESRIISTGGLLAGIRLGMTADEFSAQIEQNWHENAAIIKEPRR